MLNFIPKAFTGDEDTCPVCVARVQLEALLRTEADRLASLTISLIAGGSVDAGFAADYTKMVLLFHKMTESYRVAFAINLGIWFCAERFGRTKKVLDLLLAYDEYRDHAVAAFLEFDKAVQLLVARPEAKGFEDLKLSHTLVIGAHDSFWIEVDKWTTKRREDAFKIL